jgi:putative peptide zinc metalloprotease protein
MNLAEALNVALPDLPARAPARTQPPKVDPALIIKEQTQDGKPMVMVLIPETRRYYPFTPEQWQLMRLFDGERTYQAIAETITAQSSVFYSAEYVREFAETMADQPFWYKTAQEKNVSLWEKLTEERRRKTRKASGFGNLAEITFSAWDPNTFLTKAHDRLSFIFSRGFVMFNLALFAFTAYVWIARWGEIGRDSLEYYTFTHKGLSDIVEFWLLILVIGFVHEACHGLACKHTGGEVHRMGFLLIYLSPCFFCDVTEAWVFGTKWQRITTMIAGLWSELFLCGFATIAWWGLPPGGFIHEFSYKVILIAGVAALLINLNPLVKLDGYYILTELLDISDLKEQSTDFTTSWVKKKIFRLPVEVPHVPWKRRLLFVPYSILSGAYGYVLLFFVVSFVYNAVFRYTPQWAFVPALLLAWLVFRSRINSLFRFLQGVYLDKKDLLLTHLRSRRTLVLAPIALVLLCAPIWRETVSGRFVLEPIRRTVLRAQVPGQVVEMNASEGQKVAAAIPLVRLKNGALDSALARAQTDYAIATDRVMQARMHNVGYATADHEREQLANRLRLLQDESSRLSLASEIPGVVLTPRTQDRLGSYVAAGTELAEVADTSAMRARIYISESDLRHIAVGSQARIHMDGLLPSFGGRVFAIAPGMSAMEEGVMDKGKYIGLHLPHFYLCDIAVPNPGEALRAGMTGAARVVIRRRSIAGLLLSTAWEFISRKVW